MRLLRYLVTVFIASLFFVLSPAYTNADENFDVSFDVTYRFLEDNTALVTQTTTLTNKKTNLFATQYKATIFGDVVDTVTGFDPSGPITVDTESQNNKETIITANFSEKTVGEGNKSTFSLNYTLSGLVSENGRIKELAIPRPGKDSGLLDYKVTIIIPQSYGPIGFVKPQKDHQTTKSSYVFSFNKEMAEEGILIGIGDVAHYEFVISYHIANDSLIKREVEIAIPPDTAYQQVLYSNITPKPNNVRIDEDGNWIASFILSPREETEITTEGNVLIWTTPRTDFIEALPVSNHTARNKYWEIDSDIVTKTAKSLSSPFDIYSYIVGSFAYNYARVGSDENRRMGASEILKDPTLAICMEYTDAFIALARKSGIPAREVNGYAYTEDEFLKPLSLVADVLHAWPEYYDFETKQWKPIDPTWANTTNGVDYFNSLDFNHFVFVRHGISSTFPPAAGAYKKTGDEKDVIVKSQKDLPIIPGSEVSATFDIPRSMIAGSSNQIEVRIENTGGIGRYNIPVSISGADVNVSLPRDTVDLPPYSHIVLEGTITSLVDVWGEVTINASAGDYQEEISVNIAPKQIFIFPLTFGVFIIVVIILIYLIRKKYVKKG